MDLKLPVKRNIGDRDAIAQLGRSRFQAMTMAVEASTRVVGRNAAARLGQNGRYQNRRKLWRTINPPQGDQDDRSSHAPEGGLWESIRTSVTVKWQGSCSYWNASAASLPCPKQSRPEPWLAQQANQVSYFCLALGGIFRGMPARWTLSQELSASRPATQSCQQASE